MKKLGISFMLLCAPIATIALHGEPQKAAAVAEQKQDLSLVRKVYDKRALLTGRDAQGRSHVLELEENTSKLQKEFEKLDAELQSRRRTLQQALQDESSDPRANPAHMAKLMKEQNALQIDAEFLQKEYAARIGKIQADLEDKIKEVIDDLRETLGIGGIDAADFKSSSYSDDLDVTNLIIKKLNDQYRVEQRAKKFGADANKSEATKKA